jgi:alpha-amylase
MFLSLVFHNHQPVGQFDYVNEHATHVSYFPLIELLENHPAVHVGIHFSGHLLAWQEQKNPDLIQRLRVLVERGQVELLTGGYYEPILVALPDDDKIGQILKLSEALRNYFNVEAAGVWLAEHVWEPHLPKVLNQAGVRYTILDDTQFESIGLDRGSALFGYFITEEQGQALAVFPSNTLLQNAIPYQPIEKVIGFLRAEADKPLTNGQPKLALVAQDGERFGTWPGTYELCWGDGKYMESLFAALEKQSAWLKLVTPGEFMRRHSALGRIYLPSTNQSEMAEWSLLPDAALIFRDLRQTLETRPEMRRFVSGGTWRGFLLKYDEVNHLQKRVLQVSPKVHGMRRGRRRDEALNLLWAAQSSDPFWHGIFGGIYLFKFRAAAYANLIAAEALADGDYAELTLTSADIDADGRPEITLSSEPYNAIWSTAAGGALVELDYKPAQLNLLNILSRHREAYHADLVAATRDGRIITPEMPAWDEAEDVPSGYLRAKEPGLENLLVYDWHRRASFIDHFLRDETTLLEFYHAQYAEQGDFVNQPYRTEIKHNPRAGRVALTRDGHVWINSRHQPVTINKVFNFEKDSPHYEVTYILSHPSATPIQLRFGVEMALGFDGGEDTQLCAVSFNGETVRRSLNIIAGMDAIQHFDVDNQLRHLNFTTEFSQPATSVWWFPLESVRLAEQGFERSYQGTVFLCLWNVVVPPERTWTVSIVQRITERAS